MNWITPKTDWTYEYDVAEDYLRDYLNIEDYNRIKNNLNYLQIIASDLFPPYNFIVLGADKTYEDWWYADEFNKLEEVVEKLRKLTPPSTQVLIGNRMTFFDNGKIIDYVELNRLENATLLLHDYFDSIIRGAFRTQFRAGVRTFINI